MRHSNPLFTAIGVGIIVMLGGCTTSSPNPTAPPDAAPDRLIACEDPRPEVCTMEYNPVCGVLVSQDTRTYANGCGACSDRAVIGYRMGACGLPDETK